MVSIFLFSFLKTYAFSIMGFYKLLIYMVPKKLLILIVSVALILLSILFYFYQQKITGMTPVEISTPNEYITPPQIDIWSIENTGTITSSGISQLEQSLSGSVISGEDVTSVPKIQICLLHICIDSKKPIIKQKDGTIIQVSDPEFDTNGSVTGTHFFEKIEKDRLYSEMIQINLWKWIASLKVADGWESESTLTKKGLYFLRIDIAGGCAGYGTKQTILTLDGKESDISNFSTVYPKNFSIGNTKYIFSGSSISYSSITLYTPELIVYTGSLSIHDDINKKVHDFAIQQKFLAKNYVLEFREIPGVKILYTSSLIPSDRLVSLGTDPIWTTKNIVNHELLDLSVTKKILSYYNNSGRGITMKNSTNGYDDMITDEKVLVEQLPIFRVIPIDEQGNYLLYTTDKYEINQFAELCKPLVYIYSSTPGSNSLSVDLPGGGYFSKLIPHFTSGNTWKFDMSSSGIIDVGNQLYDYLYYSAKVPNYTWNTDGWQVRGSDIVRFFHEKLPKTGMNEREMGDFIHFWKSEFKENQRYFVSFKFDAEIDPYAKLSFEKQPKSLHRILLEAYPLDTAVYNDYFLWPNVGNKFDTRLLHSFLRSGVLDVLEWWGVVFDHDKNIFIIK